MCLALAHSVFATVPAGFTDVSLTSVTGPTALAFTPDGRLLITQQTGSLRVYQNNALLATPAITFAASTICTNSERGLLGVAVDPSFATNGFVYLFRTVNSGGTCVNRVARFTMSGNTVDAGSELVLIDNMPSTAGNHNAGHLQFGKDGYLYITIGDGGCDYAAGGGCGGANDASRDQNILLGKLLRITSTGGIPPSNPFQGAGTARCNVTGSTTAGNKCQETFAWGFRNPFRFTMDPNAASTRIFVDDVGQNAWEEIDVAQAGADYGWNCREGAHTNNTSGPCSPTPPNLVDPIFEYSHSANVPGTSVSGCGSITGGAFVPNGIWPGYDNKYLFADYNCGAMFTIDSNAPANATAFATSLGGSSAVHLLFGPFGATQALYYTTYAGGGEVRRVQLNNSAGNNAPIANASQTAPTSGNTPLTVTLNATGSSDPDAGDTLTYFWTFGDGTPETSTTSLTIQHTYAAGAYTASLRVRDNHFAFSSPVTVRITSGNTPPAPAITAPAAGTLFFVGQNFTLTGSATDAEDGTLPDSALSWTVILHHAAHTHPFLGPVTGNNVALTAPAPEDLLAATNSYLEIGLTATDSGGLSTTVTRQLDPRKVTLTFDAQPSGATLRVAGTDVRTAIQLTSWDHWQFSISAFDQLVFGANYEFSSWSDGGARTHDIVTPATPATYRADFTATTGTSLNLVTPCRLVDTRGGPAMTDGTRTFALTGRCGIPVTASALALNVTAVSPSTTGFFVFYPAGYPRPGSSTMNFRAAKSRANNAVVPLGDDGSISVDTSISGGSVHLIIDVFGYFQ
ncbi:MAG: PQQ-dependent sugar dehydrogenase [Acidobacteria bacterium]|nr:PQQ-dependent sugar dehydrogenase [Acidobacteriota bacterium]MBV9477855.1 PQQ-dependent sugar dehydrogenase [Acidobacteriota bacterium]